MKSSKLWRTAPVTALLFAATAAQGAPPGANVAPEASAPAPANAAASTAKPAPAKPPSASASGPTREKSTRGPDMRTASIALQTDGATEIDPVALRAALTSALGGVAVTERGAQQTEELATVIVRRQSGGNVIVVFRGPDGREVERRLDLPADRALATETIALAAGNLVRDEAAELVAALTPPPPVLPEVAPDAAEKPVTPPPVEATRRPIVCNDGESVFFGADFAPYAGTSNVYPERWRTLSFNFLAGYSRGLNGFELGVGANIESKFMCGVQIAAGANIVHGDVKGAQIAVVNASLGRVDGAQIGLVNVDKGDFRGIQTAFISLTSGSMLGAQVSTINVLGGSFRGAQSGVVNLAGGETEGAQVGVVNVSGGNVDGVQVGTANIAAGDVRGMQIGVVNYADKADYPLGVVSIVRHGTTSFDAWGTEAGLGVIGVRHGGGVIHNIYGVGLRGGSPSLWAMALGIGFRTQLAPSLHVDWQAIAYWVQKSTPFQADAQISSLGASFGYAITPTLGIFAAPTYNVLTTTEKDLAGIEPVWKAKTVIYEDSSVSVHGWPGATLGVRASL